MRLNEERIFIEVEDIDVNIFFFHELDEGFDFDLVEQVEGVLVQVSRVFVGVEVVKGFLFDEGNFVFEKVH